MSWRILFDKNRNLFSGRHGYFQELLYINCVGGYANMGNLDIFARKSVSV